MPLGNQARYRWVQRGGKKVRVAWVDNKVVEVKPKGGQARRVTSRKRKHK